MQKETPKKITHDSLEYMPLLLTLEEVCAITGLSRYAVKKLAKEKILKMGKICKYRFSRDSVVNFLKNFEQGVIKDA